MKKVYSVMLSVILISVLVLSAAGCGRQKAEEGFVPRMDKDYECSIIIEGSYKNFEALEAEFDLFREYYPSVELKFVTLDDYNNTISVALSGDDAPDIYQMYDWMVGRDTYQKLFDCAEDLSDSSLGIDFSVFREHLVVKAEDGSVPMLPVFSSTHGMLVNEDIFEQYGIGIPSTYEELLSACESFRAEGIKDPIMGFNGNFRNSAYYYLVYPYFVSMCQNDPGMTEALNSLDPSAGEYLRGLLEMVKDMDDRGLIDLTSMESISDNYNAVIMRFFEGDVPMMIASGDTVSGTAKRESQSEAFSASPFTYALYPVPVGADGGFFADVPSIQFAVNKNSSELDMANEFIRFLMSRDELNRMAAVKRLVTPTTDLSFDSIYAPFGSVPADHTVNPQEAGISDSVTLQVRYMIYHVTLGDMSIDEAVKGYGSFEIR